MRITKRRNPMIILGVMIGLIMSTTGPKGPCSGSSIPHDESCGGLVVTDPSEVDFVIGPASPFLRFVFLALEPMVPARGRAVTPVLRAFTRSSP